MADSKNTKILLSQGKTTISIRVRATDKNLQVFKLK